MNVGIDIIQIDRIERSIKRPRFLSRIFSPSELKFFSEVSFNSSTIAGNFCAKEAFAKAMGTGIRGFSYSDISVLRDYMGTPYISVTGGAKKILKAKTNGNSLTVSISHSRNIATAIVIAY